MAGVYDDITAQRDLFTQTEWCDSCFIVRPCYWNITAWSFNALEKYGYPSRDNFGLRVTNQWLNCICFCVTFCARVFFFVQWLSASCTSPSGHQCGCKCSCTYWDKALSKQNAKYRNKKSLWYFNLLKHIAHIFGHSILWALLLLSLDTETNASQYS